MPHSSEQRRHRRSVELTLTPEALATLARLGRIYGSRSAAVESWLEAMAVSLARADVSGDPR